MVGRLDDWLKVLLEPEQLSVDPGYLEWAGVAVFKKFADFRRAYSENGLSIDEFDSFGPTRRTLRQFMTACEELNNMVRDILLPDPDKA